MTLNDTLRKGRFWHKQNNGGVDDDMREKTYLPSGWMFEPLTENDPVKPKTESEKRSMAELAAGVTVAEIFARDHEPDAPDVLPSGSPDSA
jgi:hypothetical protein